MEKFQITYDGNWGEERVYKNIEMLSASEYISTAKQLGIPYVNGGNTVDYTALPTRVGSINNHHVSFSGGTAESNYRASVAYTGRETIIRNIGYNNYVAKLDLTQLAFDKFFDYRLLVFLVLLKVIVI